MANIKFSQFTQKTTLGNVDFLVGYTGAQNIQIDPVDLLSGYSQGTGAAGQVTFFSAASTVTGDNDFYWDNTNKRLGIGTATPGNKLEVQVTSNGHGVLFKSNATQIGSILRTAIGGTVSMTVDGAGTRPININNSSSSNVLIANGGGNVGVGTTSPVAKLQVEGSFISSGISQLGTTGANVYLTSSSAGNVGIGTSSPNQKLQVNGSVNADSYKISNTTVLSGSADVYVGSGGGTGRVFLNNTSGIGLALSGANIGIGTTSPSEKLHIEGGKMLIKHATTEQYNYQYGSSQPVWSFGGGNYFNIKQGGTTGFTISSTLKVGIGTTSPTAKLHIQSSDNAATANLIYLENIGSGGSEGVSIKFNPMFNAESMIASNREGAVANACNLTFHTYNNAINEAMRITSAGNVGIGTTNPGVPLDVFGADGIRATTNSGALTDGYFAQMKSDFGANALRLISRKGDVFRASNYGQDVSILTGNPTSERIRVTSAGNVGIGTTSPAYKLDVAGVIQGTGSIRVDAGSPYFGLYNSGTEKAYLQWSQANSLLTLQSDGDIEIKPGANNVGIGTDSPASKLEVDGGDIEVDDSASGLILRSPDGTRYRVTVANGGTLSVSAV